MRHAVQLLFTVGLALLATSSAAQPVPGPDADVAEARGTLCVLERCGGVSLIRRLGGPTPDLIASLSIFLRSAMQQTATTAEEAIARMSEVAQAYAAAPDREAATSMLMEDSAFCDAAQADLKAPLP